MKNKIIEVSELKKSFGEVRAVQEISFAVEEGSLFAFLGVNGAGKSTTIDMLCTLLKPDGGEAAISGHRLGAEDDAIRRSIGAVFQEGMLDALLTVRENLQVAGAFTDFREKLSARLRNGPAARYRRKSFSTGATGNSPAGSAEERTSRGR